jgi:hypothetical protein
MKILAIALLSFVAQAWISSCAPQAAPVIPHDNVMEGIWAGIRSDISKLAQTGKKSRWMEASEERFPISGSADLEKALRYIGDEDSDQKNSERKTSLMKRLKNSGSCYWFGFECDHSIIVVFDTNGNQTYCYPEEYAAKTEDAEQASSSNGG